MYFYRPFYPQDPVGDEWHDIIGAHMFLTGERSLFHYLYLDGSSIEYIYKAMISVYISATGGIDNLRLLPHVIYAATCAVFYLLGRETGGKSMGAAMLLAISTASITFYSSRILFSNYLLMFFIPSVLLLFLR
jgi:4-amino-4-deoxy-L-arabinose transferase-like glycosyltransferase